MGGIGTQYSVEETLPRKNEDLSTWLRFGRDDRGRGVTRVGIFSGWKTAGPVVTSPGSLQVNGGGDRRGLTWDRVRNEYLLPF